MQYQVFFDRKLFYSCSLLLFPDEDQHSIAYLKMFIFSQKKLKKSIFCMNNFFLEIFLLFRMAY